MKSILMIAYYFPPEGNAGTYRPLRFVRSLSQKGWAVSVMSVAPYRYERYDEELLHSIPEEVAVLRVGENNLWQAFHARRGKQMEARLATASKEKAQQLHAAQYAPLRSRIREIVRKIESCYYLPDQAKSWIRPAVNASIRLCKANVPAIIWATVGPVSSGVVAQKVSEKTGIPYVLDFRDPWGLNYYGTDSDRPKFAAHWARRKMYRMLKNAQAVVFLFDAVAECYQRAYPGALDDKKIHIIPNGYEGSIDEFLIPSGPKCQILYTGTASTYRYDTLLQALDIFRKTHPVQASQMCLQFVGEGIRELQKDVEALGLSEMIKTRPPTSYGAVRRLQREAHAFLILGRTSKRKGHELVAGAKLFEYLKARRPIIGVLPRDETKKILEHVKVVTVADVDSLSAIIEVFQKVLVAWGEGTLETLLPDFVACEQYSAESQACALIRALNGEMAERPFRSGLVQIPMSLAGKIG